MPHVFVVPYTSFCVQCVYCESLCIRRTPIFKTLKKILKKLKKKKLGRKKIRSDPVLFQSSEILSFYYEAQLKCL